MVAAVLACPLPDATLLEAYRQRGAFTDCYRTTTPGIVTLEHFVHAFYVSPLFKVERLILAKAVSLPSTDAEAGELAAGRRGDFAAWRVEARTERELLLTDVRGRTRSWLMVSREASTPGKTNLWFGSAIVPETDPASGKPRLGLVFRLLGGFHRWYSVALLASARRGLSAGQRELNHRRSR